MSSSNGEYSDSQSEGSGSSEFVISLVLVSSIIVGICCYVRARRKAIFGPRRNSKTYQPLSRSDFEDMVQGVFDEDDEDDEDGDLEMGAFGEGRLGDNKDGNPVKTKLDFDGDFDDGFDG
mmetsp:Transcript_19613/g.39207  ORF Transcript_19613/g.39207 Transcript_19613/m.39207 type:complete len:120 (-) Transcript_19613:62-421(-)|eukprot:CAMPEP_0182462944 /NCGR_PEP_ID=MMETSP1319-20130603/7036_1 /TAXON_ID=172717 /ORGANISM="Bolidomonas pacifica, Strain RCC208" /LENGTH=119 /DNA_ID=CAMNT_0024662429 /DNA_START=210 /DNA_END=569 /DNA_ORIENTATION=-